MELDEVHTQHSHQFAARFRGFECGNGWAGLINSTLNKLAVDCPEARIAQVKEKLGGLRIYLEDKLDEHAKAIIRRTEESSLHVCETCGDAGKRIASDGWVRVRCETHGEQ